MPFLFDMGDDVLMDECGTCSVWFPEDEAIGSSKVVYCSAPCFAAPADLDATESQEEV